MRILDGKSNSDFCDKLCKYLDVKKVEMNLSKFSDGEIACEVLENVRGDDCFVVQPMTHSDAILSLMIMADALKRASAGRITAVIPYFGYARQDRKSKSRTPITAKLIADLLQTAGFDRVITMDLHAGQIQGFFDISVDDLFARKTFIEDIQNQNLEDICIVSPDVGGAARARSIAKPLNAYIALIDKRREQVNQSEVMNVVGEKNVLDKNCIIVDDIADTCGTLVNAALALENAGAKSVRAYITHGVLSGSAKERIANSCLEELVITNTICHPHEMKKIRTVSVSEVFAEAIRRIYNNESVSNLFV